MTPYPDRFPREAILIVIDAAKGNAVDIPNAIHAAWEVAGYALGQSVGGGPVITTSNLSDVEALEMSLDHSPENGTAAIRMFPWSLIAGIVLKLLVEKLLK